MTVFGRLVLLLCALATPLSPALAEQAMTGDEIRAALQEATVITPREGRPDIRQVFYPSGRTLYNDGRDSWGYWDVRGDAYCSQWPPSPAWVCYRMLTWQMDERQWVVWIGESGTRYEAYIAR